MTSTSRHLRTPWRIATHDLVGVSICKRPIISLLVASFIAFLITFLVSPAVTADVMGPQQHVGPSGSFVLKAKRVYTGSSGDDWYHAPGIVIVRDGRIVYAGSDSVDVPEDLPVVSYPDGIVTPGLVAAASSLVPRHAGDESIAADYRAVDAFNRLGNYDEILAGGVTTVHLQPGDHRLLTGQGAVVRLGGPIAKRVLRATSDVTINLGQAAFDPPRDVTFQTPASSDVAIPPAKRQRPDSRLGQLLALREALDASRQASSPDSQQRSLNELWENNAIWRIQAQRGADVAAAIRFAREEQRSGYLVGGAEAHVTRELLLGAGWPLVYTIDAGWREAPEEIGADPDALERDLRRLSQLAGVPLALAGPQDEGLLDLRLVAATALRGGLSPRQVLEGITRVPAEILGVADRVGVLAPGRDADLVVFSAEPWRTSAHALSVYVAGQPAFQAPRGDALVVRGGTIWVDEKTQFTHGAVLIEGGKVTAVGTSVPHPPFARVIDAGAGSFVTPGWIDARGHLGMEGDRSSPGPEISPATLVGVPDVTERRVARAGVTTVLVAPYVASQQGAQVAAVKTWGSHRDDRVVAKTAAVLFEFGSDTDPIKVREQLQKRLTAAKKYVEKWTKFEKELGAWKEQKAKGVVKTKAPDEDRLETTEKKPDPITGTWEATLSGGPIPEPQNATLKLRLSGINVEGRLAPADAPEEAALTGTFDGKTLTLSIDLETPFGSPTLVADLTGEDRLVGSFSVGQFSIDFEARRVDKADVEFKVIRRRTRGKDGEPLPPRLDESLEPLRAVLGKKIPMAVGVATAPQIEQVLQVAKEYELKLILVGADDAAVHAGKLVERAIGVLVDRPILRRRDDTWYHQADDLTRKEVAIGFQSQGEDSARALPRLGLYAVERGLSADAALAAFTTQPSRMFALDDQIGSLKPGLSGDLVIFSGHPFEAGSRVERVIIQGEEVR